jgi:hypothetical protein
LKKQSSSGPADLHCPYPRHKPLPTAYSRPERRVPGSRRPLQTPADGKVSITALGVDYVGLMKTSAGTAPSGLQIVSGLYTMVPQNITFAKPATLVFSVPAGVTVKEVILMEERNGTWSDTTFSIVNNTITSSISRPGIFALFAPVRPAGTATEAIPESTYISPTSVTTAQPTPTKAGMELPIIGSGLLMLVILGAKRKQR